MQAPHLLVPAVRPALVHESPQTGAEQNLGIQVLWTWSPNSLSQEASMPWGQRFIADRRQVQQTQSHPQFGVQPSPEGPQSSQATDAEVEVDPPIREVEFPGGLLT
jgi:hypothetical protein